MGFFICTQHLLSGQFFKALFGLFSTTGKLLSFSQECEKNYFDFLKVFEECKQRRTAADWSLQPNRVHLHVLLPSVDFCDFLILDGR